MKAIVTGDSHCTAIRRGIAELAQAGELPDAPAIEVRPLGSARRMASPFFRETAAGIAIVDTPDAKRGRKIVTLDAIPAPDGAPDTRYCLCAPFHTARLWRDAHWRLHAPARLAVDEAPVSDSLIRRAAWSDQQHTFAFIDALLRRGVRLLVIESPRPFRAHRVLLKIRPEVAIHVDGIYRAMVREELERRAVPIMDLPPECYDADGFMLPEYASEADQHHANAAYGRLAVLRLLALLERDTGPGERCPEAEQPTARAMAGG